MTTFKKIAGDSFTRFGGCLYRATCDGKVVHIQEKKKSSWKTFCIMSIDTYNNVFEKYNLDFSHLYSVVAISEELGFCAFYREDEKITYIAGTTEEYRALMGD